MDWTDDLISSLRALWGEGHSTIAIGLRLGVSKNAVVGKAHRLDLPARASPIRPSGVPRAPRPVRQRAVPTLPPLASILARPRPITLRAPPAVVAPQPAPKPAIGACKTCQWPIGEPRKRGFRYCDATDMAHGKPYCVAHAGVAYVRMRDPREDGVAKPAVVGWGFSFGREIAR